MEFLMCGRRLTASLALLAFEDAPAGGDIPESAAAARVSRTFSAAGDYDYHNGRNRDVKGRVRVR